MNSIASASEWTDGIAAHMEPEFPYTRNLYASTAGTSGMRF